MEANKELYTITIYTENNVGLLNRISAIFQRRRINIESVNVSKSEIKDVSRFTLIIRSSEDQIKKIIGQLEKQVEVIKAYFHADDETIYQQTSLFKLSSDLLTTNDDVQTIINNSQSRVINVSKNFFVLEKSGSKQDIEDLYNKLDKHGIMQYVRSGRIAITKEALPVSDLLKSIQDNQ